MNSIKFFSLTLLTTISSCYAMQPSNDKLNALFNAATAPEQTVQPAPSKKTERCPFKCIFKCKRSFTTEEALMYHIMVSHPESGQPAQPMTDASNSNGSSNQSSTSNGMQPTKELVSLPKAATQAEQTAQASAAQSSQEDMADDSFLNCNDCPRTFSSQAELMLHTAMSHPKSFSMPKSKESNSNNGSSNNQPPMQSMTVPTSFSSIANPNSNSSNGKKRESELKLAAEESTSKKHRIEPSHASLFAAIEKNSASEIAELIASKADVNAPRTSLNNNCLQIETPLAYAAVLGNKDVIKLLLEANACPNTFATNALAQASQSGSLDLFFALVQAGADANFKGPNGSTVADIIKDHPMKDVMIAILQSNQKKSSSSNSNSSSSNGAK